MSGIWGMRVEPFELTPLELLQLELALGREGKIADVFRSYGAGECFLIRVGGGVSQGIVALQIRLVGAERQLFVWLMGGRHLLGQLQQLDQMLDAVAKSQACSVVVAKPTDRLRAIYQRRMGFENADSGMMRKEVSHGGRWWQ